MPFRFSFLNPIEEEENLRFPFKNNGLFEQEPVEIPSVEPIEVSPLQSAYQDMAVPGQSMQTYLQHLKSAPKATDYKPSKMTRLAAALSGASEGYFKGAGAGVDVATGILRDPFERAIRRHDLEGRGLAAAANIEENTMQHRVNLLKAQEASRLAQQKHLLDIQNTTSLINSRAITAEKAALEMKRIQQDMERSGYKREVNEVDGTVSYVNPWTQQSIKLPGTFKEPIAETEKRTRGRASFVQSLRDESARKQQERAQTFSKEQQQRAQNFAKEIEKVRFGNQKDMEDIRQTNRLEVTKARGNNTTASITKNKEAAKALLLSNPARYESLFDTADNGTKTLKPIKDVPRESQQAWREVYDVLFKGIAAPSTPFEDVDLDLDK